jgi:hypothetical protein
MKTRLILTTSLVLLFAGFSFAQIASPVLLGPASGAAVTNDTNVFYWSSSGKKIVYEIIFSSDAGFSNPSRFAVKDTFFKMAFPLYGTYFWKVRAFKSKKSFSEWSVTNQIYVGQPVKYISPGCHGNCSNCSHPCGRRRIQQDVPDIE